MLPPVANGADVLPVLVAAVDRCAGDAQQAPSSTPSLVEALRAVDLCNVTPLQALNLLARLQQQAREAGQ